MIWKQNNLATDLFSSTEFNMKPVVYYVPHLFQPSPILAGNLHPSGGQPLPLRSSLRGGKSGEGDMRSNRRWERQRTKYKRRGAGDVRWGTRDGVRETGDERWGTRDGGETGDGICEMADMRQETKDKRKEMSLTESGDRRRDMGAGRQRTCCGVCWWAVWGVGCGGDLWNVGNSRRVIFKN